VKDIPVPLELPELGLQVQVGCPELGRDRLGIFASESASLLAKLSSSLDSVGTWVESPLNWGVWAISDLARSIARSLARSVEWVACERSSSIATSGSSRASRSATLGVTRIVEQEPTSRLASRTVNEDRIEAPSRQTEAKDSMR
jgi:hypothetical protein